MRIALVLSILFVTVASDAVAADAPSPSPPPSTVRGSDEIADALFAALQRRDYEGAAALFDAKMKAALPVEKMRAMWEEQLGRLGAFQSWHREKGDPVRGLDVQLASLRFEQGELKGMVAVDPATRLVAGFFLRPGTQPALGHPAYADTTKFRSLDVAVGSETAPLGATLTFPVASGPVPAVVLIHGSGPQDRDETVAANKPFRDLAEGLSSRGIAVLRYDKRTLRHPESMKGDPTIDAEVIRDAIDAVKLLQSRQDVDPKRVFVVGHSLGALLAPEIGVRAGSVAGVALLAPPGRKPWDIVVAQMRYMGAQAADLAQLERGAKALDSGKITAEDSTFLGAPASYWLDWARRDGPDQVRKLGRPVLVLHGERDFQVTDEDISIWKTRLEGVKGVRFVSLPGLSHLFIAGSGKPGPAEYETPGHVDARVIDELSQFILGGAGSKGR